MLLAASVFHPAYSPESTRLNLVHSSFLKSLLRKYTGRKTSVLISFHAR
jgi:hypothetical protein